MTEDSAASERSARKGRFRGLIPTFTVEQVHLAAGFIFLLLSGSIFIYSFIQIIFGGKDSTASLAGYTPGSIIAYAIENYGDDGMRLLAAIILGLITGWFGLRLVGNVREDQSPVIREEDRELIEGLISKEKDKGVDQYIRLASLAGFSGNFTKLGLSGLPLATVGLTLIFVVLSLFFKEKTYLEEAAQLTLGAFLGSFVQRAVEQQKPPK